MIGTSGRNDVSVAPHHQTMHFAQVVCKRLLHSGRSYALCMSTPNERLKAAREKFFSSAGEAADAMGIPRGTYAGHENGYRGFPAKRAPAYARRFKVSEEWLLYGRGEGETDDSEPSVAELEAMLSEIVQEEVRFETRLADLPRILASALHTQLERFRSGLASPPSEESLIAPDRAVQSPPATKQSDRGGSRRT